MQAIGVFISITHQTKPNKTTKKKNTIVKR